MKHLINNSVYSDKICLDSIQTDGVELLTSFNKIDESYRGYAVSVHLPFCMDWYGVFTEKRSATPGISEDDAKFYYYGRNRKEIVANVRDSIKFASDLNPKYGVFHACSGNFDELIEKEYTYRDTDVVSALTEMMNQIVSEFPSGEPPFKILFENLWYPGMRLTDEKGFNILKDKLEFDNWGVCLDTGHLLISMGGANTETEAIEMLKNKIMSFSDELKNSIELIHLHINTSAKEISELKTPIEYKNKNENEKVSTSFSTIVKIDRHLPFNNPNIVEVVDMIKPQFVNHEMGAVLEDKKLSDYRIQRMLFS